MTGAVRPIVVVSRCLELAACRYDGQTIRAPLVTRLEPYVTLRPVCPEIEIGLGVPRDPIRLVSAGGRVALIQPATGRDLTARMREFSATFLSHVGEADGFILKSRSPSCGIRDTKVYDAPEAETPVDRGAGLFGSAVLARFPDAAVEDEERLEDERRRHHFLTRLFVNARFRAARAEGTFAALRAFHAEHELLLLAQHRTAFRQLGRIVAHPDQRSPARAFADYADSLRRAMARPARRSGMVNALLQLFDRVSARLTAGERATFLERLAEYRAGRIALDAPLGLAREWTARIGAAELSQQVLFYPYPGALRDRDGGSAPPRTQP